MASWLTLRGLGRHVRLACWLDRKWASTRENVGGNSEGETVWGVPETRTASPTEERQNAVPHRPTQGVDTTCFIVDLS